MGWVWRDDDESDSLGNPNPNPNPSPESSSDRCSTRRIVQSNCHTEEVEPGKFVRKCEKTEQVLRDCLGKPTEIVQSNKEFTEEDVTEEMMKGSSSQGSFDMRPFAFPGLRSDIEAIERSFFGGINRFFEAADEMRDGFFRIMDDPSFFDGRAPSSSSRRGIPIEGHIQKEPAASPNKPDSGDLDISGLARDV